MLGGLEAKLSGSRGKYLAPHFGGGEVIRGPVDFVHPRVTLSQIVGGDLMRVKNFSPGASLLSILAI